MQGKGDTQRPAAVDQQTFAANYERTFGKRPLPDSPAKLRAGHFLFSGTDGEVEREQ